MITRKYIAWALLGLLVVVLIVTAPMVTHTTWLVTGIYFFIGITLGGVYAYWQ
jgi:hypothetical protein